jgi:uncharacterized protein YxjI
VPARSESGDRIARRRSAGFAPGPSRDGLEYRFGAPAQFASSARKGVSMSKLVKQEGKKQPGGPIKLVMREKIFDIGDDFWVEDDNGNKVFKVDGKTLRLRDHFVIETAEGKEVLRIKERKLGRDRMAIERDGDTIATVKKALISPFSDKYVVDMDGSENMKAKGGILDHEYEIERDGDKVAEVSKKWFRARDTYGIEIEAGEDPALMLAIAVCIDELAHDIESDD